MKYVELYIVADYAEVRGRRWVSTEKLALLIVSTPGFQLLWRNDEAVICLWFVI